MKKSQKDPDPAVNLLESLVKEIRREDSKSIGRPLSGSTLNSADGDYFRKISGPVSNRASGDNEF